MPNPILTDAIDRLCRGEALTADEATRLPARGDGGHALRGADGRAC